MLYKYKMKNKMEPKNPNANEYSKTNTQTIFDNLVRDTFVGHSCRTLLSDILVGHSCRALLWDTCLVCHSCWTLLQNTLACHPCGTLLSDTCCLCGGCFCGCHLPAPLGLVLLVWWLLCCLALARPRLSYRFRVVTTCLPNLSSLATTFLQCFSCSG